MRTNVLIEKYENKNTNYRIANVYRHFAVFLQPLSTLYRITADHTHPKIKTSNKGEKL